MLIHRSFVYSHRHVSLSHVSLFYISSLLSFVSKFDATVEVISRVSSTLSTEAMEVEQSDSNEPGLLSMGGKAEELVLSHLSRGEGGLQGLLNLRLVCSITKGWVDDLQLLQGRRLFSNCQALVDLKKEGVVEEFVDNPPPAHVTSLSLEGVDSSFDPKRGSWLRFIQFWSTRLESLEVVDLSFPLNGRLYELLPPMSLRSLRCKGISCAGPADIPEFFFYLEELRLDFDYDGRNKMTESGTKAIFQDLGRNARLRNLQMNVETKLELKMATELIDAKKDDSDLRWIFSELDSKRHHDWNQANNQDEFRRFVRSVAASSSTICVEDLTQKTLLNILTHEGDEVALKFFRCVDSILGYSETLNEALRLSNFPNLEQMSRCRGVQQFPHNLTHLEIGGGFPPAENLPPLLTSLELMFSHNSVNELVADLPLIGRRCPNLQQLVIHWDPLYYEKPKNEPLETVGVEEEATVFPKLRSLILRPLLPYNRDDVEKEDEEDVFTESVQLVLLAGLGLPRLPITSFVLEDLNYRSRSTFILHPVIDAELLTSLLEGPISKTLCNFEVSPNWAADETGELTERLFDLLDENERKRLETHGRQRRTLRQW